MAFYLTMNVIRYIICFTVVLYCNDAAGQALQKALTDTFFYDNNWQEVPPKKAQLYRPPVEKNGERYHVKYYYSNHILYYEGIVKPGNVKGKQSIEPLVAVGDGEFTYYDENGVKNNDGQYTNGIATGIWKEYYNTGNLKCIKKHDNGQQQQYIVNYYDATELKQSEGAMVGVLKSGKMQYKRDGRWVYYNQQENNKAAIINFSAGVLDGDVQFYDSTTGNIILKGKYSLNMKSGQWTYYNPVNKMRTAIINFERGEPHGDLFVFYPGTGNMKQTGVYSHGKRHGLWSGLYDCKDRRIQWQADYKKDRASIVYYDSANNDREIRKGNLYVHQRVGLWLEYHPENGRLKTKETYNNNLLEGVVVNYDKNGFITSELSYSRGMKNGRSVYYFEGKTDVWTTAIFYDDDVQKLQINYPSGKPKRVVDELKLGDESSICYTEQGGKESCDELNTDAHFNGDVTAYIGSNLKYPEEAKLLKMEGKVKVGFTIGEDGTIKNPYIIEGFDSRCDEEALRLVAQMPAWKPASIDNTPVATNKILPIVFAINPSEMHAQVLVDRDNIIGDFSE